jgi:hypothetical protein
MQAFEANARPGVLSERTFARIDVENTPFGGRSRATGPALVSLVHAMLSSSILRGMKGYGR